jgi:hypothetical protein
MAGEGSHNIVALAGKLTGMVAVPVINAMRAAGMQKVDELVTQAMLHPELARTLLAKLPTNPGSARGIGKMIASQIMALSAVAAVRAAGGSR